VQARSPAFYDETYRFLLSSRFQPLARNQPPSTGHYPLPFVHYPSPKTDIRTVTATRYVAPLREGGSLPYTVAMQHLVDPDLAARVVWLDALTTNIDRTPRNPNLLIWHRRLWLIDHGASLYLQHTWTDVETRARTPFPQIADHVLLPAASSIAEAGRELRPRITPAAIESIVARIPDDWLVDPAPFATPDDLRRAYIDLILTRLSAAGAFEAAAEQARLGVAA
jgi:hypothetical protein